MGGGWFPGGRSAILPGGLTLCMFVCILYIRSSRGIYRWPRVLGGAAKKSTATQDDNDEVVNIIIEPGTNDACDGRSRTDCAFKGNPWKYR